MAKRLGAVIKFKRGVSRAQAAEALARISEVLDFPATSCNFVTPKGGGRTEIHKVPFKPDHILNEYDAENGEPVWYIP